jgi:excisionase family DNA binding protein
MAGEKLLLRPEEAAELLSIGRSKVYELIGTGELASVRIGASRRIPAQALAEFVQQLQTSTVSLRPTRSRG